MARRRMIKPEFWTSETLARVSRGARLTFVGLWNHCDDYGVTSSSVRRIIGEIYPLDESVTEADVRSEIDELLSVGLLVKHRFDGRDYLIVKGWDEHQRVDKPSSPSIPIDERNRALGVYKIDKLAKDSRDTPETLAPEVEVEVEVEREIKKAASAAKKSAPLSESLEKQEKKPAWQPIPVDVSELIVNLVQSRRKLGQDIRSDSALSATLRQAYRDNPGEAELWKSELSENEKTLSEREKTRKDQVDRFQKKQSEDEESDAQRERDKDVLRRFEGFSEKWKSSILLEAKKTAGCEDGPDTPWLYVREIEAILEAAG